MLGLGNVSAALERLVNHLIEIMETNFKQTQENQVILGQKIDQLSEEVAELRNAMKKLG